MGIEAAFLFGIAFGQFWMLCMYIAIHNIFKK